MARQLVRIDDSTGKLVPNVDALAMLVALPPPLRILSVSGVARSGKSTWLNLFVAAQCLTGSDAAHPQFSVGHTSSSHTMGVWAWAHPMPPRPASSGAAEGEAGAGRGTILLLDTQASPRAAMPAVIRRARSKRGRPTCRCPSVLLRPPPCSTLRGSLVGLTEGRCPRGCRGWSRGGKTGWTD